MSEIKLHNGDWWVVGSSPVLYNKMYLTNTKRNESNELIYSFKFYCQLESLTSYLFRDYDLLLTTKVGSTSKDVYVKYDTSWGANYGYTYYTTITFDINVGKVNPNQTLNCSFYLRGVERVAGVKYYGSGTFKFTVSTPAWNYTAVGAPSQVYLLGDNNHDGSTSYYLKPSGKIKVGWNAGSAGTNNPVAAYDIYVRVTADGENPSYSSYTYYKRISSGSTEFNNRYYEFTASNLSRGYKVRVGVQSVGTQSNYSSGLTISGTTLSVNYLPNAPSSYNKTVSHYSSDHHIEAYAGNANGSGQTSTLWYSKSTNKGNITQYSSSSSFDFNTTYYFWTWDGLEYSSSYSSAKITQNPLPNFSSVYITCPSPISVSGNSAYPGSRSNLVNAWYLNISGTLSNKTTGTLSIYLKRRAFNSNAAPSGENDFNINTGTIYSTRLTNGTFSINNLNLFRFIGLGFDYWLGISFNDGLDTTTLGYLKTTNDSKFLTIAPAPSDKGIINNCSNTSIGLDNYFWKDVRFRFSYDSGLYNGSQSCLYYPSNNTSSKLNATFLGKGISSDGTMMYFDFRTSQSLTPGQDYGLNITLGGGGLETACGFIKSLKQCPLLIGISQSNCAVKPFSESSVEWNVSISNSTALSDAEQIKTNYCLANNYWETSLILNEQKLTISNGEANVSADYLTRIEVLDDTFWNKYWSYFTDKDTNYELPLRVTITNLFGRSIIFESSHKAKINFIEPIIASFTESSLGYLDSSNTFCEIAPDTDSLIENLELRFRPEISIYNSTNLSYRVQISRGDLDSWVDYKVGSINYSNSYSRGNPVRIDWASSSEIIRMVGEIADNNSCYFRIILTSPTGQSTIENYKKKSTNDVIALKRLRHVSVPIDFLTASYSSKDNTSICSLSYNCPDIGVEKENINDSGSWFILQRNSDVNYPGKSDEDKLYYTDNKTDWNQVPSTDEQSKSHSFTPANKMTNSFEYWRLYLCTQVTFVFKNGLVITNVKKSYSKSVVVYNITPTISPRSNHLGINYHDFEELPNNGTDTVLAVGQTSDRHVLYFVTNDRISKIDIRTGDIDNFVLDGGTW